VLVSYGPADVTASQNFPSSLASFKSRLVLPFWYRLTHVVLEKRPLNGCSSSNSSSTVCLPFSQVRSGDSSAEFLFVFSLCFLFFFAELCGFVFFAALFFAV